MKKIFLGLLVLFLLVGCSKGLEKKQVKIDNNVFQVEIADTSNDRYQGLSGRISLGINEGMLFRFEDYQIRNFIMRDMNFPLDVIWIKDNRVVGCTQNISIKNQKGEVNTMASPEAVNIVLEINAGFCEEQEIKNGSSFWLID